MGSSAKRQAYLRRLHHSERGVLGSAARRNLELGHGLSSKACWYFEGARRGVGGVYLCGGEGVRIRHVGSGRYLAVNYAPMPPISIGGGSKTSSVWFDALLVDEPTAETLFTLEPALDEELPPSKYTRFEPRGTHRNRTVASVAYTEEECALIEEAMHADGGDTSGRLVLPKRPGRAIMWGTTLERYCSFLNHTVPATGIGEIVTDDAVALQRSDGDEGADAHADVADAAAVDAVVASGATEKVATKHDPPMTVRRERVKEHSISAEMNGRSPLIELPTSESKRCLIHVKHVFPTKQGAFGGERKSVVYHKDTRRHVDACYLHFVGPEHGYKGDVVRQARHQHERARVPEQSPPSYGLVFSEEKRQHDRLAVERVPEHDAIDVRRVLHFKAVAERYIKAVREYKRRHSEKLQPGVFGETVRMLTAAVTFLTEPSFRHSSPAAPRRPSLLKGVVRKFLPRSHPHHLPNETTDPFHKPQEAVDLTMIDGASRHSRQEIAREGKLIDAIFEMLHAPVANKFSLDRLPAEMARVHVLAFKVLANMVVRNKRSEFYFTSHTVDDLSSEPTASGKQPQIDWARALKSQIPDLKTLAKGDGGVQTGKSWVKYIAHGEPITWIEGVMRWRLRSQEALQSAISTDESTYTVAQQFHATFFRIAELLLHNRESFDFLLNCMACEDDDRFQRDGDLLANIYKTTQHDLIGSDVQDIKDSQLIKLVTNRLAVKSIQNQYITKQKAKLSAILESENVSSEALANISIAMLEDDKKGDFLTPAILNNLLTIKGPQRALVHQRIASWMNDYGLSLENEGNPLPDKLAVPSQCEAWPCFIQDVKKGGSERALVGRAFFYFTPIEAFREAPRRLEYCYSLKPHPAFGGGEILFSERIRSAILYSPAAEQLLSTPIMEQASYLAWRGYGQAGTCLLLSVQIVFAFSTTAACILCLSDPFVRAQKSETWQDDDNRLNLSEDHNSECWWLIATTITSVFFCTLQIIFELVEFGKAGWKEYLADLTNFLDWFSCILCFSVLYTGFWSGATHSFRAWGALLIQLVWVKFFKFMPPFELTSNFVPTITQILKDMVPFAICCSIVLIFMAVDFKMLGMEDTLSVALEQSYSYIIGEFDFQSAKIDVLKPYAKVIWVQYSLLGAVVLLNALIAIMGDSFSQAKQREHITFMYSRADALHNIERVRLHVGVVLPWKRFCSIFYTHVSFPKTRLKDHLRKEEKNKTDKNLAATRLQKRWRTRLQSRRFREMLREKGKQLGHLKRVAAETVHPHGKSLNRLRGDSFARSVSSLQLARHFSSKMLSKLKIEKDLLVGFRLLVPERSGKPDEHYKRQKPDDQEG